MSKTAARSPKTPASLSQRPISWYLTVREFPVWVEMDNGLPAKPFIVLAANEQEQILHMELLQEAPEQDELRKFLYHAMLHPPRELRQPPCRPQAIICDREVLADELRPLLAEIEVDVQYVPVSELLDEIIEQFEEEFGEQDENPGLLSEAGSSPELAASLFAAAADAYRQEPWIYLSAEQPVKFTIPALQKNGFVQLMGNSGIEYGLLLYWNWEDLELSYFNTGDPRPTLPQAGWTSFSYATADLLPSDDLEAIEKYAWPVAAPDAYPLPMVMFADHIERPDQTTLNVFTLLLRALPEFVQRLEPDFLGDYQPLTLEVPVPTRPGPGSVGDAAGEPVQSIILQYPAGKLRREAFPAAIPLGEEGTNFEEQPFTEVEPLEIEQPLLPDEITGSDTEKDTDWIDQSLEEWENSPIADANPALVQAMVLVYQADVEIDPAQRIQLARQALEISPDCAQAYVILAEDLAVNVGQALKFYQKGVDVGYRTLGAGFFEQYAGEFWQHAEARPYLYARAGLARTLWELGRRLEALEHLHETLRLDVTDYLSAHYAILLIYLEMGRWEEAYHFANGFEDTGEDWLYTTALLDFRQTGDTSESQQKIASALQANPHIPDYLTGRQRLPADLPEANNPGHKSGAIHYAATYLPFWRQTPEAIDWLRKYSRASAKSGEQRHSPKHRPSRKRRS
jgi:tetratricopeptide (TPR) repeat protein